MRDIVDEKIRAMRERIAERRRAWLEIYSDEFLSPTFPPILTFHHYPGRSPSGSLLTHAELICSGPNYHLIEHAADGTVWLSVHETLPLEHDLV